MIIELALLFSFASPPVGPGPAISEPRPVSAAAATQECDRDCVWVISLSNFRCVVGTKGYDCIDYPNGCGMTDCGGSFLVDAGGALRQFATCEQNVQAAKENAAATGTAFQLDEALRTGLMTANGNSLKLRQ
jgi:hypothetical protein